MAIAAKKATAAPQLTAQQKLQQLIKSTPAPAVTAPRPMASAVPTGPTITAVKGPSPVGQSAKQQAEAQRAATVAAQQAAARQAQQVAAQQAAARAQQVAAQAAAAQQAQQQRVQQIQQQLAPKPVTAPAPVQKPIQQPVAQPAPVQQAPAPVQQPVTPPQDPGQSLVGSIRSMIDLDQLNRLNSGPTPTPPSPAQDPTQINANNDIQNIGGGWGRGSDGTIYEEQIGGGWFRSPTNDTSIGISNGNGYSSPYGPPIQTPQPTFNLPNPVPTPVEQPTGSLFNAPPTQQQPVQNPPTGLNNITPGTSTPGQPTGLLPDNASNFGFPMDPVQQPVTAPGSVDYSSLHNYHALTGLPQYDYGTDSQGNMYTPQGQLIVPGSEQDQQIKMNEQQFRDAALKDPTYGTISPGGGGSRFMATPAPGIQSLASLAPGAGGIYANQPTSVL